MAPSKTPEAGFGTAGIALIVTVHHVPGGSVVSVKKEPEFADGLLVAPNAVSLLGRGPEGARGVNV